MENGKNRIVLGLDISTTCIGYCVMVDDGSEHGRILTLGHVAPKVHKSISGIKSLFLKKRIFKDEFVNRLQGYGIEKVIIEEPLLRSNNVNTVSTLLLFNGMISDCIYELLGIVPDYISSHDARAFSFPELLDVRKYNKKGEVYPEKTILKSLKTSNFTLFGGFVWDCDKKVVMHGLVSKVFPDVTWLVGQNGSLKKENYDACDAYVACLGQLNKERHGGDLSMKLVSMEVDGDKVDYVVELWGEKKNRTIYLK